VDAREYDGRAAATAARGDPAGGSGQPIQRDRRSRGNVEAVELNRPHRDLDHAVGEPQELAGDALALVPHDHRDWTYRPPALEQILGPVRVLDRDDRYAAEHVAMQPPRTIGPDSDITVGITDESTLPIEHRRSCPQAVDVPRALDVIAFCLDGNRERMAVAA